MTHFPPEPYIDEALQDRYAARFNAAIPVGPWHSTAVRREAEKQARFALAGGRGRLSAEEFPMDIPADRDA